MNIVRTLLVISIAGGAYSYWTHRQANSAQLEAGAAVSESGFVSLPHADGQDSRTVFVVAARGCPHEDAQRADRLTEDLSRRGIPVERVDHVDFRFASPPDSLTMGRINKVMKGPLPIVFVAGRAKSNPSLDEVVIEFEGSRRGA